MIYKKIKSTPSNSLNGTTVLNTFSIINGANVLRVHDVKEVSRAVLITEKIMRSE